MCCTEEQTATDFEIDPPGLDGLTELDAFLKSRRVNWSPGPWLDSQKKDKITICLHVDDLKANVVKIDWWSRF